MLRQLWGKITGADKRLTVPDQQASVGGRIGDYTVIYPYGLYCDLPVDVYMKEVGRGALIPTTVKRPSDHERGEPVLFHPVTNTRIILRNNGDIDILANDKNGELNINCKRMNIITSEDRGVVHNGKNIGATHTHPQPADSDGDAEADTNAPNIL